MGICYLLFYEHVSVSVCFDFARICLSRPFGRKTVVQRCGWLFVTCFLFSMTGVSAGTGVDGRLVDRAVVSYQD